MLYYIKNPYSVAQKYHVTKKTPIYILLLSETEGGFVTFMPKFDIEETEYPLITSMKKATKVTEQARLPLYLQKYRVNGDLLGYLYRTGK